MFILIKHVVLFLVYLCLLILIYNDIDAQYRKFCIGIILYYMFVLIPKNTSDICIQYSRTYDTEMDVCISNLFPLSVVL